MSPRPAWLGIDVGAVRIGVAACPAGVDLAVPLETVPRGAGDLQRIRDLATEHGVQQIYVGDPLQLNGQIGQAAREARRFARNVADSMPNLVVMMIDERLTTAQSSKQLRSAGRNTRKARSVLDQAAAVAILQNAMDMLNATGKPAGTLLRPRGDTDQ